MNALATEVMQGQGISRYRWCGQRARSGVVRDLRVGLEQGLGGGQDSGAASGRWAPSGHRLWGASRATWGLTDT